MKFFCIEWWDASQSKYHQEYFKSISLAFDRYVMLERDIPEANPDISTLHMAD
jgi:hypothetical protein